MVQQLQSEKGSVVLLALMVLMLITLFGISSLNTSDTELKVSQNNRCYKQNIYRAEGIIMEVAQMLEVTPVNQLMPTTATNTWFTDGSASAPDFDPENKNTSWAGESGLSIIYPTDAAYAVVFEGIAPGGSLTMTSTQMWQYGVYGKSERCDGDVGVVAGYRRRF